MKSKVADPDHRTDSLAEVIALVRAKVAPDRGPIWLSLGPNAAEMG